MNESTIVGDEPCPKCREMGRDKSGNHLIVFSNGNKYCNRCGYKSIEKSHSGEYHTQSRESMMDVSEYGFAALEDRKIRKEVCERFGVRVGREGTHNEIDSHYYPVYKDGKITGYKVRVLPKEFRSVGDCKGKVELFGQSLFKGGKKLLITGGELDCLSAYQMLKDKYPQYEPSVVSLPKGESLSAVADNIDYLNHFEEVLIYTDMDDVGKKCAKELASLIGPKAKIVKTTEKDASDMLVKGKQGEFINAYFSARMHVPDGILTVEDVWDDAIKMPEWGRLWPWPSLNRLTYGKRDGEGIFVGAGVKAGKTEWLSQMVHHICYVEKRKVLMFKFEQGPGETCKAIAGKAAHKQFHKPDGDFTQQELIDAVNDLKGKVLLFDAGFSDVGKTNLWDRMKPAIRHAVLVEGVKDVFIDPITQITDGMTAADTDVELRRFSNELAGMAKDLGFFYYCFCHLKAPETGKTHEEGGDVKVAQFRGSRAMAEKTKYMLGIMRNQYAEDDVERNTSTFHLLLNSGFGKTGRFHVYYDDETGEYLEPAPESEDNGY